MNRIPRTEIKPSSGGNQQFALCSCLTAGVGVFSLELIGKPIRAVIILHVTRDRFVGGLS